MRGRDLSRYAPLTGAIFGILLLIGVILTGDTPDVNDSRAKVVKYWSDNDTKQIVFAVLAAIAAALLLWFGASLRERLRLAEGGQGRLSSVVFASSIVGATAITIGASLSFATADSVGDVPPDVTHTLSTLSEDFFFPFVVGFGLLMLTTGLLVLRTRAVLPRWFAWISLLLGIISFTPLGFIGFLGFIPWIVIASIALFRGAAPATPGTPATAGAYGPPE